jgi:hypothetical protein
MKAKKKSGSTKGTSSGKRPGEGSTGPQERERSRRLDFKSPGRCRVKDLW